MRLTPLLAATGALAAAAQAQPPRAVATAGYHSAALSAAFDSIARAKPNAREDLDARDVARESRRASRPRRRRCERRRPTRAARRRQCERAQHVVGSEIALRTVRALAAALRHERRDDATARPHDRSTSSRARIPTRPRRSSRRCAHERAGNDATRRRRPRRRGRRGRPERPEWRRTDHDDARRPIRPASGWSTRRIRSSCGALMRRRGKSAASAC